MFVTRNKLAAMLLALTLAGCVRHDPYGNPIEPRAANFTYQPVKRYTAASHAAVGAWCRKVKGDLTADGDACVWTWKALRSNNLPCLFVFAPEIPTARRVADEGYLRSVCNGW